ncbi:MAG: tRNA (adenosine(37)-N6)-dimethylallyltransferase MiaA [Parcubacteria group bacterium]|nr:tRNA (adenosine(37)-N6)-dimethylallyltransferase MiaA [Parcubacteria group bacterium]
MAKPKLIAILGPTASGKSTLAIGLAQKFGGEIISADSRQVYRGLDIGAGKVTIGEQAAVPHHLLDIVEPGDDFSVAGFQRLACAAIGDILERNKIPFLAGGTALYAYAVIDNYQLADVPPNPKLRNELAAKSLAELQAMVPPGILNEDDYQNPRRLIRAIEKLRAGASLGSDKLPPRYDALILGIDVPREELYKKIDQRVDERIEQGMIEEVERLRQNGVSDEWLVNLGLEYAWITEHLQGAWPKDKMIERLKGAIHAFARRQMAWFNRDQRIHWVQSTEEARSAVREFLA